ncbi:MAG: FecR domain-containing protein [Armatimonadota bacterium]
MKKIAAFLLILFFCAGIVHTQEVNPCAAFLYLKNNVKLKRVYENKSYKTGINDLIMEKDQIITTENSYAVLYLWDKSTVKIAPDTHMVLSYYNIKDGVILTKINLIKGKIQVYADENSNSKVAMDIVKPFIGLETVSANFEAEREENIFTVKVRSGSVEVKDNYRIVELIPGRKLYILLDKDEMAEEDFNTDDLSNWDIWNKEVDNLILGYGDDFPKYINFTDKANSKELSSLRRSISRLKANKTCLVSESKIKVEKNVECQLNKLMKIREENKIIKKKE